MFKPTGKLSPDEDVFLPEEGVFGIPQGGMHAKGAARRHIVDVFRKMDPSELVPTVMEQKLQALPGNKPLKPKSEKWVTTDLVKHTQNFKPADSTARVAEFQMRKKGFSKDVAGGAVPQRAARYNPGMNVFNNERGVRNYGIKGQDNLETFNKFVVKVKQVNPNQGHVLRYLSKHKVGIVFSLIGAALDTIDIYLAVRKDDGTFGPATTIAVSEASGGLAGAIGGAEIGAALGSLLPGLGTIIGGFIGGLAGGIAGALGAGGIAGLFITVPYVPTPQWTEITPFCGDPQYFDPLELFGRCDHIFEMEYPKELFHRCDRIFELDNNIFEVDGKAAFLPKDVLELSFSFD